MCGTRGADGIPCLAISDGVASIREVEKVEDGWIRNGGFVIHSAVVQVLHGAGLARCATPLRLRGACARVACHGTVSGELPCMDT